MFEKFKKQKGFSLVELMVVVAIMGILSGIAIPQYLQYRRTAAIESINADMNGIARAFLTCVSVHGFDRCDEFANLAVSGFDPGRDSAGTANTQFFGAKAPFVCVDTIRVIGGAEYGSCVELNSIWGSYGIYWGDDICYSEGGPSSSTALDVDDCNMNGNRTEAISAVCTGMLDAGCFTQCGDSYLGMTIFCDPAMAGTNADAYCQNLGFGSTMGMCGMTGFNGVCDTTTGRCS